MSKRRNLDFEALSDEQKRTVRCSAAMLFGTVIGCVVSFISIFVYWIWAAERVNWPLVYIWFAVTGIAFQVGIARSGRWMKRMIAEGQPAGADAGTPPDSN